MEEQRKDEDRWKTNKRRNCEKIKKAERGTQGGKKWCLCFQKVFD